MNRESLLTLSQIEYICDQLNQMYGGDWWYNYEWQGFEDSITAYVKSCSRAYLEVYGEELA